MAFVNVYVLYFLKREKNRFIIKTQYSVYTSTLINHYYFEAGCACLILYLSRKITSVKKNVYGCHDSF